MKEFSQILVEPISPLPLKGVGIERDQRFLKYLASIVVFCTFILTTITIIFVFRYESRMIDYELRVTELEADFQSFFNVLEEEVGYNHWEKKKEMRQVLDHLAPTAIAHHHETPSGDSITLNSRKKRQIEFPNIPNSFPSNVERTEDGVPIVDQSYQISSSSSSGSRSNNKFQRLLSSPALPTPDSQGLRLYEGLVETGGRNEPKSLDFFSSNNGASPLLPHHKVSAAWSEKQSSTTPLRSGLQLRSGDGLGFDEEFGRSSSSSGGPQFANELTYTRSSSRPRSQRQRGSSSSRQSLNSNSLTSSGSGSGSGATYHRNSRVAATSTDDQHYYSNSNSRKNVRHRATEYPPLRRLPLGDGKGEVIARVVQTNEDDGAGAGNSRNHWNQNQQRRYGNERRRGNRVQQEYLARPPVETFIPSSTTPESPQEFTEGGQLNVTIRRSQPFGTYYSSSRGNWEINTSPPTQRYRNRY